MNRHEDPSAELIRLQERVRELEAELLVRDRFIIAAAHELRNPISPLVLHASRLSNAARKAEQGTLSARWLEDQMTVFSGRLARFLSALNRILDVSRIHGGQIDLVVEECDLSEVVREVASGFERELLAAGSELTLSLESAVPGTWDRMRLEQIISNLLSNAIRYGNSQPIEVALRADDRTAELTVRDRGIGIADHDQQRIFERFERANTSNRAGFGVGLWIVRQLCEAMGGTVTVQSRAGEGATFLVTLPTHPIGSADDR